MIYAQWDGTKGVNQQSDAKGYLIAPDGHKIAPDVSVEFGLYPVVVTEPSVGTDQIKDTAVWGFADDQISLTWTVRDKTSDELAQEAAGELMGRDTYYAIYTLLNLLISKGVCTQQEYVSTLPSKMVLALQYWKEQEGH